MCQKFLCIVDVPVAMVSRAVEVYTKFTSRYRFAKDVNLRDEYRVWIQESRNNNLTGLISA